MLVPRSCGDFIEVDKNGNRVPHLYIYSFNFGDMGTFVNGAIGTRCYNGYSLSEVKKLYNAECRKIIYHK